jgi:hypothetical protein
MWVELDYPALRIAAREFYEEQWEWGRVEAAGDVANRRQLIEQSVPPRTLAEGYYVWVAYLVWLLRAVDHVQFRELHAADVEGLKIVIDARNEFLRHHPRCARCGAMNDKFAMNCCECRLDFTGKAKR